MLNVTGQRPKNKTATCLPTSIPIVGKVDLEKKDHPINSRDLSGKKKGSLALVMESGAEPKLYVSSGDAVGSPWSELSSGGAGGGGGVQPAATRLAYVADTAPASSISEADLVFHVITRSAYGDLTLPAITQPNKEPAEGEVQVGAMYEIHCDHSSNGSHGSRVKPALGAMVMINGRLGDYGFIEPKGWARFVAVQYFSAGVNNANLWKIIVNYGSRQ